MFYGCLHPVDQSLAEIARQLNPCGQRSGIQIAADHPGEAAGAADGILRTLIGGRPLVGVLREFPGEPKHVGCRREMLIHQGDPPSSERYLGRESHQRCAHDAEIDQFIVAQAFVVGIPPVANRSVCQRDHIGRRAADIDQKSVPVALRQPDRAGHPVGGGDQRQLPCRDRAAVEQFGRAGEDAQRLLEKACHPFQHRAYARRPVGEIIGQFAGHRHGMGPCCRQRPLRADRSHGRFELVESQPERARALHDTGDAAVAVQCHGLQMGAADVPADAVNSHGVGGSRCARCAHPAALARAAGPCARVGSHGLRR